MGNAGDAGSAIDFRHQPERGRFVAAEEEEILGVLDYVERSDGALDYRRTFVPPEARGRGIATRLVRHGLDWALEHERKIVPSCPFVGDVIDADERYAGLRA